MLLLKSFKPLWSVVVFILLSMTMGSVWAEGVDKVYHPYVNDLEKEFEYRMIQAHDNFDTINTLHKLGFGMALNESWFSEVYLIASQDKGEDLDLYAYEFETKWQITEQGEYAVDWGLLLELEKRHDVAAWEAKVALLSAKEWGRFSGLVNVFLIQEWGNDIDDALEGAASAQLRYRYRAVFEPALEWHKSEYTHAAGPAFMGTLKVGTLNALFWNAGVLWGLDNESPDYTIKLQLEYEFY